MVSITRRIPLYNTHSMTRRHLPHRHDVLRNAARLRTRRREQRRRNAAPLRTRRLRRRTTNTNAEYLAQMEANMRLKNDMKRDKIARFAAQKEYDANRRAAKVLERTEHRMAVLKAKQALLEARRSEKKAVQEAAKQNAASKKAAQEAKYIGRRAEKKTAQEEAQEAAKQNADARKSVELAIQQEEQEKRALLTNQTKEERHTAAVINNMYR